MRQHLPTVDGTTDLGEKSKNYLSPKIIMVQPYHDITTSPPINIIIIANSFFKMQAHGTNSRTSKLYKMKT